MNFIIDYEVCACFFMVIITIYFLTQKKLPTIDNTVFSLLLILLSINMIFDIIAVIMQNYKESFSIASHYIINISYYLTQAMSLALFFAYMVLQTRPNGKIPSRLIILMDLPLILFAIFALFTPLTKMLFYIDESGTFLYGDYHFSNYILGLFYIGLIPLFFIINRKKISRNVKLAFFAFFGLSLMSQIIQMLLPNYLINSVTSTAGILIFFLKVQSPRNHIDNRTELFNSSAFQYFSNFCRYRNEECSLMVFSLDSLGHIDQIYGVEESRKVISQMASYFTEKYPNCLVFRYNINKFIVLSKKSRFDDTSLYEAHLNFPKKWEINGLSISSSVSIIGLNSKDVKNIDSFFPLIDFTFSRMREKSQGLYQFIDQKALVNFNNFIDVTDALVTAIENKKIEVHYQPIFSIDNQKIFSIEALARLKDKDGIDIPPEIFIDIAEKNGLITKLSELVLENVCLFLNKVDIQSLGISRVSINLSVIQFMQANFCKSILTILEKYQINPQLIGLEIIESVATSSVVDIKKMMNDLIKYGFCFYLDDYGKGYSNIEYITNLPFEYIKIDKSLIASYSTNSTMKLFLDGIIEILKKTNRYVIVEGAETKEHVDILRSLGVKYIQGFYYQVPISLDDMIDLLKK